jgi:hypothetical protein
VKGLQAGIGFPAGDRDGYRIGDEVTLAVYVRNAGEGPVKIAYSSARLRHVRPLIEDANGRRITGVGEASFAMPPSVRYVIPTEEGGLKPGEEMLFGLVRIKVAPPGSTGIVRDPELRAPPGEYTIGYTVRLGKELAVSTGTVKILIQPADGDAG